MTSSKTSSAPSAVVSVAERLEEARARAAITPMFAATGSTMTAAIAPAMRRERRLDRRRVVVRARRSCRGAAASVTPADCRASPSVAQPGARLDEQAVARGRGSRRRT